MSNLPPMMFSASVGSVPIDPELDSNVTFLRNDLEQAVDAKQGMMFTYAEVQIIKHALHVLDNQFSRDSWLAGFEQEE